MGPGFVQVFGPGASPPAVSGLLPAEVAGGGSVSGTDDSLVLEAGSAELQSLKLFPRLEGGLLSGDLGSSAERAALLTTVDMETPTAWGNSPDSEGGPVADQLEAEVHLRDEDDAAGLSQEWVWGPSGWSTTRSWRRW
ncbi:hypothetical protein SKAU_G00012320 [Synaphobranchus kaupii]|uniref:Uncharacterized protein n=1 Tax=Synaphobranchus kaupii TaxID=118154 RepID=A0A9Q1GBH4_SYNKA|nr:hypothetical protein SKAU_G00012320 [Synaphobranchus kaupii]